MTTPPQRVLQAADAVLTALAMAAVAFAVSAVFSLPLGFGWAGVKFALFFVGFLLFGYATFQLLPRPPYKEESVVSDVAENTETTFQSYVQKLPPLRWYSLHPADRLSPSLKLFLGSLAILAVSYAMETVFGVRVGP